MSKEVKKNLLIIGAGGHGKVCAEIASKIKDIPTNNWNKIEFLDDNKKGKVLGFAILENNKKIAPQNYEVFIAIGDNHTRSKLFEKYENEGFTIPTLVDPTAIVSESCRIGKGSVIMPGVVINADSEIGDCCIINTKAVVEHDNIIGNYVHISPATVLLGNVEVGDYTWIGANSTIKNGISINDNVIIGMGSKILKSIEGKGIYFNENIYTIQNP